MSVFLIGAGGHAKVIIATLHAQGIEVSGIYDDDAQKWGSTLLNIPVLGRYQDITELGNIIIAVGNNRIRKKIQTAIEGRCHFVTAVHPHAIVHESVEIGAGSVIFAGVVVQPDTRIGKHCIINTGATLDHDNEIEDFCHIAPGCHFAGGVHLHEGVFCGVGASIVPYTSVGEWTTIGAGATVTRAIPAYCTAVGIPAKPIKFHT